MAKQEIRGWSQINLSHYLNSIQRIFVDEEVKDSLLTRTVKKRLSHLPFYYLRAEESIPANYLQANTLYLKAYKGAFLRFCPGTRYYNCCGYRIIHIGENCPLNCSYCILKAYFQDPVLKVWANQDELWKELDREFSSKSKTKFRAGTGEFTDSLALECITGYSRDLVSFLGKYTNVCLELKSKIVDLSWMEGVKHPERVLPAWSLNAPGVVAQEEKNVASLEERLEAAQECIHKGFRVCLHFDPVIWYSNWEKDYAQLIEMLFDYIKKPEQIAYISLGSFRCMPELKEFIARNWPQARYIYEEFITGLDGKLRLLRPLRVKQFKYIVNKMRHYNIKREQLYFCMESDEVWESVFGYTPKDLGGLSNHLLKRAFV